VVSDTKHLTYKHAGVDIAAADSMKEALARELAEPNAVVLNRVGAFGSIIDPRQGGIESPLLVLKVEEPGSKQILAMAHDRVESLASDLIHHLTNDVAMMGAKPLAVLDVIVCARLDPKAVLRLVRGMDEACKRVGCFLVGGETSEQPGLLDSDRYVLAAAAVGVVARDGVIDGSKIARGDLVLAVGSSGPHTNGYSLLRRLLEQKPEIATMEVGSTSFLDAILVPHASYVAPLVQLFPLRVFSGLAHITGGGIAGNLRRVVPPGLEAVIDLREIRIHPVFRAVRSINPVADADFLATFNLGVGMIAVVPEAHGARVAEAFTDAGHDCYPIGVIGVGEERVRLTHQLHW
jgi:phosphoribosylformylglycinamidine cyclo-ligase